MSLLFRRLKAAREQSGQVDYEAFHRGNAIMLGIGGSDGPRPEQAGSKSCQLFRIGMLSQLATQPTRDLRTRSALMTGHLVVRS